MTQKAYVTSLASLAQPRSDPASQASQDVIDRIRKCLARANHANANEHEAQTAMKTAHKIMMVHNIENHQVIQVENKEGLLARAGCSQVKIAAVKTSSRVIFQTWVGGLVTTISKTFNCRAYSTQYNWPPTIKWTFYGPIEHTVSAALTFEMIHHLIQDWASRRNGIAARNSYCLDITDGLKSIQREESIALAKVAAENGKKASENLHARKMQSEQTKAHQAFAPLSHIGRIRSRGSESSRADSELRRPSPVGIDHSKDDQRSKHERRVDHQSILKDHDFSNSGMSVDDAADEEDDGQADFIEGQYVEDVPDVIGISALSAVHSATLSVDKAEDKDVVAQWPSSQALAMFRHTADEMADELLKDRGIKLRCDRKRKRNIKDREEYNQGREDSKMIKVGDVVARRIEDTAA